MKNKLTVSCMVSFRIIEACLLKPLNQNQPFLKISVSICCVYACHSRVIRVTDFSPNAQREDKFRIQLYEHQLLKSELLGTKEIVAFLYPTSGNNDKQPVSSALI